ncbi:MAG TPA: NAD(P)/FAD-dependent oxidoreductase [Syntrophorhabdaceae bacterium]|jgi:pyruvate/2-oxoglutarate dehydrogenase complex dihydrolipoamide dehydrogenase (E3) component
MSEFDYDLIVVGGGAAGMVSSSLAAGLGKKVALVEHRTLGGECTRSGCVPSKALIKSANIYHYAKNAGLMDYGLSTGEGENGIRPDRVFGHVRNVVGKVYHGHRPEVFRERGMELVFGKPAFLDNHHIDVDGKTLSAESFIIATGSRAFIPPIEGIAAVPVLTNETVFELERLPSSMIVLGGGPIGTELAQALARLGVAVTIVEMAEQILIREEKEMRDLLAERFAGEGLTILTRTKALKLEHLGGLIHLTVEGPDKEERVITAETILVAVGRKPNIEDLDLNKAGVDHSAMGITTDKTLRTAAPNIYACGDVVGPYQFSHMAEYQARIATQNALLPVKKHVDYEHYIWCMFTDPELAHAGLTEEQARADHGSSIKVYKWEYANTDRGKTEVEEFGFCKIICDDKYKVLGAHIMGSRAGDLIHELQIIKTLGLPLYKLDSVIHIYPTFSDVIRQPAKQSHIDELKGNIFVQLLSTLFGKKEKPL